MKNQYYIYTLSNSATDEVFYVGCTMAPEKRLIQHMHPAPYDQCARRKYIDSMSGSPVMKIIEDLYCGKTEAMIAEAFWILALRAGGYTLCNMHISQTLVNRIAYYQPFASHRFDHTHPKTKRLALVKQINSCIEICENVSLELAELKERTVMSDRISLDSIMDQQEIRNVAETFISTLKTA